ncbi:MAG: PhoU family transcriptional regulator [Campylobacterales bacterium]|nr:PhoU family transcriptional regulator [Campylobacterales bacterium]
MLKNYEEKQNEIKTSITSIGDGLLQANKLILESIKTCDNDKFNEAKTYIRNVSQITTDIDNTIITTLALHSPEAKDLRAMVSYLKITNELLRAATNTRAFIKGFVDVCTEVDIKTIKEYTIPMQTATVDSLKYTIDMINTECVDETQELFNKVLIAENKTDDLYDMIQDNLFKKAQEIKKFEKYYTMLSALRKSKKIADRAMSIASLLLFANVGGDLHQV